MAISKEQRERREREKVEYDWGTLWPQHHSEKMNWGKGFKTKGDVDILFLAGSTGRDPLSDAPCRAPEEERAGKGKVVGEIKEQTRATLMEIKNSLEIMGASLKNMVFFRYYLPRREDIFDMRDEMYRFFREFEADLLEHPRPATLCRGVGIDLADMRVEIEPGRSCPGRNDRRFS